MDFHNSTHLESQRLEALFRSHAWPYRHDRLKVNVRYSRGADFSGTCYYEERRIYVNVGPHVRFPYRMGALIARSRSNATHWWREVYHLVIRDGEQLALFVFLHEFYHYLIYQAGRNPRRKEAMCDRFAARVLADHFGVPVLDGAGKPAPRDTWDFQDLHGFVAAAPKARTLFELPPAVPPAPIPVVIRGLRGVGGG